MIIYAVEEDLKHRVGRVISVFSCRRNWDYPTPLAAGECAPLPFGLGGGRAHSLAGEGLEESQFRRGDIHCGALYTVLCNLNPMVHLLSVSAPSAVPPGIRIHPSGHKYTDKIENLIFLKYKEIQSGAAAKCKVTYEEGLPNI